MRTPLRIGRVVRWGRSLTAKETASLKTSRLTWNFMEPCRFLSVVLLGRLILAQPFRPERQRVISRESQMFKELIFLTVVETVDNPVNYRQPRGTTGL